MPSGIASRAETSVVISVPTTAGPMPGLAAATLGVLAQSAVGSYLRRASQSFLSSVDAAVVGMSRVRKPGVTTLAPWPTTVAITKIKGTTARTKAATIVTVATRLRTKRAPLMVLTRTSVG